MDRHTYLHLTPLHPQCEEKFQCGWDAAALSHKENIFLKQVQQNNDSSIRILQILCFYLPSKFISMSTSFLHCVFYSFNFPSFALCRRCNDANFPEKVFSSSIIFQFPPVATEDVAVRLKKLNFQSGLNFCHIFFFKKGFGGNCC